MSRASRTFPQPRIRRGPPPKISDELAARIAEKNDKQAKALEGLYEKRKAKLKKDKDGNLEKMPTLDTRMADLVAYVRPPPQRWPILAVGETVTIKSERTAPPIKNDAKLEKISGRDLVFISSGMFSKDETYSIEGHKFRVRMIVGDTSECIVTMRPLLGRAQAYLK